MFHVPRNNGDFRPTCSQEALVARAKLLKQIRDFFDKRGVLEVETPLLAEGAGTDLYLQPFATTYEAFPNQFGKTLYLQTSPEFAMKRLLAAGSGPIYQICKAFRNGEVGAKHNPEFTMLEWYRPGWDHIQLMQEMEELFIQVANVNQVDRITYQAVFQEYLRFDPFDCDEKFLQEISIREKIFTNNIPTLDKDGWLNFLFSHCIEPGLGKAKPIFVYDYPASQAMLAKTNGDKAERFECYFKGIELANGFHELTDQKEQSRRFHEENIKRKAQDLPEIKMDALFLEALDYMPGSAGVALGLDRLLMIILNGKSLAEVVAFPLFV